MKRVEIGNKSFKVIPEARLIQGEMVEKSIENDLKAGIKEKYKKLIRFAGSNYECAFNIMFINTARVAANAVVANAYCDEKDEFDEKVGIDVCSEKLELKNHLKLARLYRKIARDLSAAAMIANNFCTKHEAKAMAIEEDLVRMYGREYV